MKRAFIMLFVASMAAVLAPVSASANSGQNANGVTRWVELALDAVRAQNVATPNAGRLYAMVTVGMYDAVNGVDRAHGQGRTHALVAPSGAPAQADRDVGAAAAAHAVLSGVLRADQPPVSNGVLDAALAAELDAAGGEANPRVTASHDWGAFVGKEVLRIRRTDGTQAAQPIGACSRFTDPLVCEPGEFHASFDGRFRSMTPFAIADAARYRSEPPPALTAAEYGRDYEDVRTCGSNSATLNASCADPTTPAQRAEISSFWLAEGGTVRETGTWIQAALAIVEQQATTESTSRTARLFALVGMSIADAVKVSWEAKATHFSWRPTTAIRRAEEDGNPTTVADPGWTSRIGAVDGSPEYNSGTSAFAGAASAAIEEFYCGQTIAFSFQTDMASNGPRTYANPLEAAREAGRSRIYQGIHFQFSNEDGRRAGRDIGKEIATTKLQPVDHTRPRTCAEH